MTAAYRERTFGWHSDDALIKVRSLVSVSDGCWEWMGPKTPLGYGAFYFKDLKKGAHRYIYELAKGFVEKGLELDHLCRNPGCVNPSHLEAVTHRENIKRGVRFWQYCPHGDMFRQKSNRTCTVCRNIRRVELYAKQKQSA